ncbi:MAG: NapC/NirT family cytochrome c [SAR324 cluster bacterium]|nr:NapC/NirT family cytochrome c [SAR324 cluster bacterium]
MNETENNPGTGAPERRQLKMPLNFLNMSGFILALIGVIGLMFLFFAGVFSKDSSSYVGIGYAVLFGFTIVGIVLFVVGHIRGKQRQNRGEVSSFSEHFLLTHPLMTLFIGSVITVSITLLLGIASYKGYHVTESVEFCGQTCHSVMKPEWTTYHESSHARVKCVECHIGGGADWYVKSKLSGLRQVFAVMANSYSRPIPTPIHDLRPARETCETCHWPKKFIGYRETVKTHFLSDEDNTPYKLRMLIKIGGEETMMMKGRGIHYHMLLASKVEYIARDEKRQNIAWVRIKRSDGSVSTFNQAEKPLTEEERKTLPVRVMDCMDCHNRPAHKFPSPMDSVNQAMESGVIPLDLPYIKKEAVKAIDTNYETTEEAVVGIANTLRDFYKENYPDIFEEHNGKVEVAINGVQEVYQKTIFPEMKTKWSAYPDNIGHRDWQGCFRCHTDQLQSDKGETIFTTCDKCHLILAQGENIQSGTVDFEKGLEFRHPIREGDDENEKMNEYTDCSDCHTGGAETYE